MARPHKKGLDYYSCDTDRYQDTKIKRLKHSFGVSGLAVYDYILCEIYRDKGCFIEWDESTVFNVSDYLGLKESLVKEIVNYCCTVCLFDKELLASEKVLTSFSIQERYSHICKSASRKNWFIPELIKLSRVETELKGKETIVIKTESTQSIVKESKGEESIFFPKEIFCFRISNLPIYEKITEYFPKNFGCYEPYCMKYKKEVVLAVLKQFEVDKHGYTFRDNNHIQNAVRKACEDFKNEKQESTSIKINYPKLGNGN